MTKRFFFSVADGQQDPSESSEESNQVTHPPCSAGSAPEGQPAEMAGLSQPNFFVPVHYTASYRYPLVVYLHGAGNNARELGQVFRHISLRNYVAAGVTGNRAIDQAGVRFDWNMSDGGISRAISAVETAIDTANSRYNIHSDRIILVGNGSGGTMALRIATEMPHRYAGVVSIGGRMPKLRLPAWKTLRRRKLPMLWQWGLENPDYDPKTFEQDCKSAMLCGAKVDVHQYPTDDEMDTVVLSDINQWIMQRVVNPEVSQVSKTREVAYSLN